MGAVHALLRSQAPEWAVPRPSWFMQNFEHGHYMAEDVRAGTIMTSVADGRVAFIDADDIAEVAFRALTDATPHQAAHVLTGPAALSYDDVAEVLTRVTSRPVAHDRTDREAVIARMVRSGLDPAVAGFLAHLEDSLREGIEDRVTDTVERVTGRAPRAFEDWVRANARAWS